MFLLYSLQLSTSAKPLHAPPLPTAQKQKVHMSAIVLLDTMVMVGHVMKQMSVILLLVMPTPTAQTQWVRISARVMKVSQEMVRPEAVQVTKISHLF